ncbi:hypothetical protein ACFO0M_09205 [Micromonospora mangrovi]|uniref:Uncharacterized protein n=2 Tax=Micromonospora TaxID=1873 RepID=A0AAU8HCD8_9ACTN
MGERSTSTYAGYLAGLALRVAELRERFPDALVSCDVRGEFPGPDLICWNGDPEEIWVWLFEPDGPDGVARARERLREFLADPREVTGVVAKRVVAGPNSAFPAVSVEAASPLDSRQRVEVRHGPVDGIQLHRDFDVEKKTPQAERTAMIDAVEAATDADAESREALGFRRAETVPADFTEAPAAESGSTWQRPEVIHLQLTVELPGGAGQDGGRVAREWFESAWRLFHDLLPPDVLPSDSRVDRSPAGVLIGAVDPEDEERSWEAWFSNDSWEQFRAGLGRRAASVEFLRVDLTRQEWLATLMPLDNAGLDIDLWHYQVDDRQLAVLGIEIPRALFVSGESAALALLRRAAEEAGVLFGLVGIDYGVQLMTGLEYALYLHPWDTVRSVDRTLRGYSWVTIVSEAQTARLGGAEQLRASGAFARVEQLAGGGCWLQATETFAGYTDVEAEAVFRALRPLLPEEAYPSTFKNEWRDV